MSVGRCTCSSCRSIEDRVYQRALEEAADLAARHAAMYRKRVATARSTPDVDVVREEGMADACDVLADEYRDAAMRRGR